MQLLAVAGHFQGSAFDVVDDRFSIGSDPSNSITLVDGLVAKHHCYLQKEGDGLKLVDTSDVGTFINGLPAKEQILRFGDLIRVGESVFRFADSQHDDTSTSVTLEDDPAGDSIVIRPPQLVLETLAQEGTPLQRDLKILVQLSTVIHSMRALYESKHRQTREIFERHLLDFIFESVPAQRGAVLITDDSAEDFTSVYGYDRVAGTQNPIPVSRAIVDRVLTDAVVVIQTHCENNPNLSVIAVPLIAGEKVLGVIYLDSLDPEVSLDENHLQLLTAVAGIAGFALESARNVERLQSENRRLQDEIDIQHDMVGESPRMVS